MNKLIWFKVCLTKPTSTLKQSSLHKQPRQCWNSSECYFRPSFTVNTSETGGWGHHYPVAFPTYFLSINRDPQRYCSGMVRAWSMEQEPTWSPCRRPSKGIVTLYKQFIFVCTWDVRLGSREHPNQERDSAFFQCLSRSHRLRAAPENGPVERKGRPI